MNKLYKEEIKTMINDLSIKAEKLVKKLVEIKRTVSCMESCTGGGLADKITNIQGASGAIKFSAVTYSNDYKIKMGVSSNTIDKYSVYSIEVAREMAKSISIFADSDYGIGITGKLNCADENNVSGRDDVVFLCIYDRFNNTFYNDEIKVTESSREANKHIVIERTMDLLLNNI